LTSSHIGGGWRVTEEILKERQWKSRNDSKTLKIKASHCSKMKPFPSLNEEKGL
jgi:hypothetical protein